MDRLTSRVLKNVFNTLLIGPRMAQRNHAQFYVLDFESAAKTTLFASDVGKGHGWTFQQPVRGLGLQMLKSRESR